MKTAIRPLLAAAALALAAGAAGAADTYEATPAKPDKLTEARALIAQRDFAGAVGALQRINDTGSADWNNLMGFSLRKSPNPDYAAAERYYDAALRIDPTHRNALEYSGELYLMTGNLAKAEQRLAALDKACFLPCSQYTDLKNAIAAYKTNGKRK